MKIETIILMFIIRPKCNPSHQIQKNTYVGGCFMFENQNAKCKRTRNNFSYKTTEVVEQYNERSLSLEREARTPQRTLVIEVGYNIAK